MEVAQNSRLPYCKQQSEQQIVFIAEQRENKHLYRMSICWLKAVRHSLFSIRTQFISCAGFRAGQNSVCASIGYREQSGGQDS